MCIFFRYSEAVSSSTRTDHYSQLIPKSEEDEIGDNSNAFVKQNDLIINEIDDSDDWRRCNVCGTSFDDEKVNHKMTFREFSIRIHFFAISKDLTFVLGL